MGHWGDPCRSDVLARSEELSVATAAECTGSTKAVVEENNTKTLGHQHLEKNLLKSFSWHKRADHPVDQSKKMRLFPQIATSRQKLITVISVPITAIPVHLQRRRPLHMACRVFLSTMSTSVRMSTSTASIDLDTTQILIARNIKRRVRREEIRRPDVQLMLLHRHHRPVLNTRVMCEPKNIPHDDIGVVDVIATSNSVSHPVNFFLRLVRELATGPELTVFV